MFHDRRDAGKQLAQRLMEYKSRKNVIVLAIPRGAVQCGYEIAKALGVPLGAIVTKKIPHPREEEVAIGAVAPDGSYVLNERFIEHEQISSSSIRATIKRIFKEIKRRKKKYTIKKKIILKDKIIILVDDGIATGYTAEAALRYLQAKKPKKIVLAVPVAHTQSLKMLRKEADDIVCLLQEEAFTGVGDYYKKFPQLEDKDVLKYLMMANKKYASKI